MIDLVLGVGSFFGGLGFDDGAIGIGHQNDSGRGYLDDNLKGRGSVKIPDNRYDKLRPGWLSIGRLLESCHQSGVDRRLRRLVADL